MFLREKSGNSIFEQTAQFNDCETVLVAEYQRYFPAGTVPDETGLMLITIGLAKIDRETNSKGWLLIATALIPYLVLTENYNSFSYS